MEKSKKEIEDQELADKINAEILALDLKRGNGITLEKNEYIGDRTRELNEQLAKLKTTNHE
jgi:molybdopterin-biosynthesis enzyme MoeA-like protein